MTPEVSLPCSLKPPFVPILSKFNPVHTFKPISIIHVLTESLYLHIVFQIIKNN